MKHYSCFVNPHRLVLDAFKKVEPTRKCFRLIGGVLVERTVQEIQPSLEENLVNVWVYVISFTCCLRLTEQSRI